MSKRFTFQKCTSLICIVCFSAALTSCGGGKKNQSLAEGATGNITAYENSDVNAIQQALPTIMVIPSDNLLKNNGALTTQKVNGKDVTMRDYQKFLSGNSDNKAVISMIQDAFVQVNYPIQSLEQTLKQLDTQAATDLADGVDKDAKTMLLTTAQPDMIIELDYQSVMDMNKPLNEARSTTYTINVIDAYTNNVLSSSSESGLSGETAAEAVKESFAKILPKTTEDIQKAFSDILTRGRNITVRIAVGQKSNISFEDTTIDGDTYSDWIVDYMKTHTVKGAYKMQRNTNKEMYFVNCRIPLLNEDGTQYGVYDWARTMCRDLRKNLGVKAVNKAQGLGEVLITIDGL